MGPDNRQGLLNRLGQSGVPQPATTNEAKNSLLTRREVDQHGVQEFRSVHENRRSARDSHDGQSSSSFQAASTSLKPDPRCAIER